MKVPGPLGALRVTDLARLVSARAVPGPPPAALYRPDGGTEHALDLARRAGHPVSRVRALATTLGALDPRTRRAVVDPLGRAAPEASRDGRVRPLELGGDRARQTDATTCGSAVLGLLAAAGDPVLALWLATGLHPEDDPGPRGRSWSGGAARFGELQQAVKRRTNHAALGPLPWPASLGTPPWGAARAARHADVRYVERVVVGARDEQVVRAALAAAACGVPVPLFTGGNLALGIATAVPRHVVLLTDADARARRCRVYEPSSGTVHDLDAVHLLDGARSPAVRHALGGWPHVCWALLPAGRQGWRAPTRGARMEAAATSVERAESSGEETR
ncbi:hypothetical protein FB00_14105 [Cellulosimicrobium funkei]|uniref:Uncharacterized protein n=1 Tax=Cellulosimicrobium funkei TaxID=264251 RepID=A0A0H2KKV2_9MICO|nr:hypothetical protein [Cellulosimicrobium funkei]KLN34086.1 hypothetical protein FB00_14105 [Cellulosimicrobium funkei]